MFSSLPDSLRDGDLSLKLLTSSPGNAKQGLVSSYKFQMIVHGCAKPAGTISLRIGDTDDLVLYFGHIGYGVEPAHRGHHYAARACRLLLPLARRHEMETLWITCNPDNIGSRRTCELLGATLAEIVDVPKRTDLYWQGDRQKCRYRLDITHVVPLESIPHEHPRY